MRLPKQAAVLMTACLTIGLTGCGELDNKRSSADETKPTKTATIRLTSPSGGPAPTLPRAVPPAAAAGGLCTALDYGVIKETTGLSFDVAAPNEASGSRACAVRATANELPILTLSAISVEVKPEDFTTDYQPEGANKVDGVGQVAYSKASPASDNTGPAIEIGWSTGQQVHTLALQLATDVSEDDAKSYLPKLTDLAKRIK